MDGKQAAGAAATAKKRRWIVWIAAAALAGALTGGILGLGFYANSCEEVFPGVMVGDADLSGLSFVQLETRLPAEGLLPGEVSVSAGGQELAVYTREELGARVDEAHLRSLAWGVGREEGAAGWFKNAWTMLRGRLGAETRLEPDVIGFDEEVLRRTAAELAQQFDRAAVDGACALTDEGLFATKPADGRALDQEGLVDALLALEGKAGAVEAPWSEIAALPLDLERTASELGGAATPARYDVELGRVVEGRPGAALDLPAAQLALESAAPGETIPLPARVLAPELTAQELEAVLFRDVLGTATTTVSGTGVRKGNVKLSGSLVNGTVLNDGDLFDYNLVVGERTAARGFGAAASYVNGETVDTIGGGICQTSSTIYLAALLSNLEIVERYNHRYWPGYVTLGMDATVSWGGPEFRFRNNTGYPIRIDVAYDHSRLTVTILGTKTDDTYVEMTHRVLGTTEYETEYVETEELPWGEQRQQQSGYRGYEVVTYRNVYDGSGRLLSSEEEARSSYKSRNRIILTGTAGMPSPDGPGDGGASGPPVQPEEGEPELPPD